MPVPVPGAWPGPAEEYVSPKSQSTTAQSARRASRSGVKYTEALRREKTSEAPRTPHIQRLLAERSGNLYHLVGGIAAAWAHSGQRVLLLEEAEATIAEAQPEPPQEGE